MFNIKNSNTEYPLFFGDELGLSDSFNVTYPELLKADEKQRELFWSADEISLVQDAQDLIDVPDNIYELMVRALSLQLAGDSIANGSIAMLFLPILTNPQAKGLVSYWNDTESVHDKSYSLIVAQCFKDPNKLLERIREDEKLIKRLELVLGNFRTHMEMVGGIISGKEYDLSYKRKTTIRTITSLLALEGIMFLSSFATTFAICESEQKCNGIAKMVGLIHDDESGSHVRNNLTFLDIIINKEKWPEFDEVKDEVKSILDSVINAESKWADDLFIDCGSIVGYNSTLAKQYTKYLSKPIYDFIGVDFDFDVVQDNPLPWIDSYIKPDLLQVANQEAQQGNYKVNASVDDTDDFDFDFDEL
jgi:ribonucleoside-diphosphate reductase beta chain